MSIIFAIFAGFVVLVACVCGFVFGIARLIDLLVDKYADS